ncbi:MAG: hypothetical protein M1833_002778 [Piccolia ochrophora]|nr:MAG: hypothetical protein M1833_002778 [Piccolia ochrophora]
MEPHSGSSITAKCFGRSIAWLFFTIIATVGAAPNGLTKRFNGWIVDCYGIDLGDTYWTPAASSSQVFDYRTLDDICYRSQHITANCACEPNAATPHCPPPQHSFSGWTKHDFYEKTPQMGIWEYYAPTCENVCGCRPPDPPPSAPPPSPETPSNEYPAVPSIPVPQSRAQTFSRGGTAIGFPVDQGAPLVASGGAARPFNPLHRFGDPWPLPPKGIRYGPNGERRPPRIPTGPAAAPDTGEPPSGGGDVQSWPLPPAVPPNSPGNSPAGSIVASDAEGDAAPTEPNSPSSPGSLSSVDSPPVYGGGPVATPDFVLGTPGVAGGSQPSPAFMLRSTLALYDQRVKDGAETDELLTLRDTVEYWFEQATVGMSGDEKFAWRLSFELD